MKSTTTTTIVMALASATTVSAQKLSYDDPSLPVFSNSSQPSCFSTCSAQKLPMTSCPTIECTCQLDIGISAEVQEQVYPCWMEECTEDELLEVFGEFATFCEGWNEVFEAGGGGSDGDGGEAVDGDGEEEEMGQDGEGEGEGEDEVEPVAGTDGEDDGDGEGEGEGDAAGESEETGEADAEEEGTAAADESSGAKMDFSLGVFLAAAMLIGII